VLRLALTFKHVAPNGAWVGYDGSATNISLLTELKPRRSVLKRLHRGKHAFWSILASAKFRLCLLAHGFYSFPLDLHQYIFSACKRTVKGLASRLQAAECVRGSGRVKKFLATRQ
jgi:hypothetical protein